MLSLAILGAAAIMMAHSLIRGGQPEATGSAGQRIVGTQDAIPGASPAAPWDVKAPGTDTKTSAGCGTVPGIVPPLGAVAAGNEAVFVLLPGEDPSRAEAVRRTVDTAVRRIKARGRRTAALTLAGGNPQRERLAARLAISKFPAVVVLGQGCGETVISSGITDEKLLQAFVAAAQPSSSCGTSGTCGSCATP